MSKATVKYSCNTCKFRFSDASKAGKNLVYKKFGKSRNVRAAK